VPRDPIVYGKYQLLELLARGGMGEVWKARSHGVEGFEKILVIKRILAELSRHQQFVDMFIDEAKVAVALTHANVVQVFDLGLVEGTYFIAMEYVPGFDLATVLRWCKKLGRPMPQELAVYVVSEIAKGLDYAHRRRDAELNPLSIVHRDVSPENVLLSNEGEVKLTDFGIARSRASVQSLTQLPPGKFAYLAPEQAREEEIDARADLFALGAILFEALSGVRAIDAKTPLETLERAKRGDVGLLHEIKADVPSELAEIVTRALAPSRTERYPNAGELYEDLIQFLYASGRRVGTHDLSRFLEELSTHAAERPRDHDDPPSGIEEIFAERGSSVTSGAITPLAVPSRASNTSIPAPAMHGLPPRSEWREVTVLALDGLASDPALDLATRYGGTRFPGEQDGPLLIVFGLGEADGHDAQTAARCALRLLRSDPEASVRALVHSGRMLVDSEGEPREHASLLSLRNEAISWLKRTVERSASASSSTAKLLRGRFELAPALGDAPRAIERERRVDEGVGKFVGRREELRRIGEALALGNRGNPRVVGIKGDAGTGKSRLLTETARRLRHAGHDVGFFVATCSAQGRHAPFSAIQEILRAVLGIEEMESEPRVREKVERLKLLGLSAAQRDAVGRVLGLAIAESTASSTTSLEGALLRISYKLAQDRLTVFAWDGAELMDTASRALIGRLAESPPDARVVFILTYRPSDPGPWVRAASFTEVVIDPIAVEDVARLARHRLIANEMHDDLVNEIFVKTGGNPLYVEELLAAMREAGAIDVQDGIVLWKKGGTSVELPRTLRGLVASRVGKLPPGHRSILQVAVTFGPRFVPELVARAAEQDEPTVRTVLAVLEERGIVRVMSPSEYMFAHDLVREVLYEGIALDERPALHAAVASAIESLRPAEVEAVVDRLAHHHREAGNRDAAIRYTIRAAERFEAEHALDAAIDAYLSAIDLLNMGSTPDRSSVLMLYTRIGELAIRTRSAESVAERLAHALELAESLNRDDYVARFSMMRGRLLNKASRFQEGRMWLERAQAVAKKRGDRGLMRDVALAAAEAHARNGEYKIVVEYAIEALELSRATDDVGAQVRCLLNVSPAYAALGQTDLAMDALRELEHLIGDPPDRLVEVELFKVRSLVFHQIGDQEGRVEAARRAMELAKEYGFPYEMAVNAHNLGEFLLRVGEDKRAFSALRLSYEVASEHGFARLLWLNVCLLGFLDAMRFNSDQGKQRMAQAIRYAEERGYTWDLIGDKYLLALVEQKLGDLDAARGLLREVIQLAGNHGHLRMCDDAEQGMRALDAGEPISMPR
jgi:serine/threonine protein kinase/predicted ATPase